MKLKDILNIRYGKNQSSVEVPKSDIPILGTGGIIGCACKPIYTKPSVLIGRKGTIDKPFYIDKPFWTIDTLFYTEIDESKVIPKYLYYHLSSMDLSRYQEGAAVPSLTTKTLYEIDIPVHSINEQQHIVNTIGSIDDLIEKYQKIESKVISIGLTKINSLMSDLELQNLNNIVTFEKGYEVGSNNYIENPKNKNNLIKYIRVGDLDSSKDCFIQTADKIKTCNEYDILIAFDGAPGRLNVGLNGAYSSGIYKAKGINKGLIYFSLLSELNQKIIKDNSQGTTILHASKAIPFLKYPQTSSEIKNDFDCLFNLLIELKKKKNNMQKIKQLMLNKYFTN